MRSGSQRSAGPTEACSRGRLGAVSPSPARAAPPAAVLWRRLDVPGHDACRLERSGTGWRLDGAAALLHAGAPARLAYRVDCDGDFRAPRASVSGWLGPHAVEVRIERAGGVWTLNGAAAPELGAGVDLDLGFTPATNLIALRRLNLGEGQAAEAPAAWLDDECGRLSLLTQRYERRSATEYWYESPTAGYAALLLVDAAGFVRRYPGLWEREP